MNRIAVRFLGVFKKVYGRDQIFLETAENEKLIDVIWRLANSSPDFGRVLIDPELKDPRPNAVILLNGKEISALAEKLETKIQNNDRIVFIPVVHGG